CTELGKRCKENTGEDCPKIDHIQSILVHRSVFFSGGGGYYAPSSFCYQH
ncbi:NB-ARC domain disease resistance protein, partial [Trifolium medium]|nr:NB-ARC domain disease resistance protein [Trifolium medium]